METASPQEEIFLLCMNTAIDLFEPGYPNKKKRVIYDYLPGKEAEYPFLFMGEAFDTSGAIKMKRTGQVLQTIHGYGTFHQRAEVSEMLETLRNAIYKKRKTFHYYVDVQQDTIQMSGESLGDKGQDLVHGILELRMNYY